MAKCANCGKTVSCGCKLKKAKDGRRVCVNCLKLINADSPIKSITFKRK